ncbi:MAG: PKD domain-containing protein, partial [Candidatus Bathyarchaeota archaeon]|nr:PKD domain-containing protein [Candidatus Bathyarchaeota archaeon]
DPEGKSLRYLWEFGDDFTSTLRNPKHSFTSAGRKSVKLTVTDDENEKDTVTKIIQIVANVDPISDFSVSSEKEKVGNEITFTEKSSDTDGHIISWLWDFGDDTTSNEENPTHIYSEAGVFTISLTIIDDDDSSSVKTMDIEITEAGIPGFSPIAIILSLICLYPLSKRCTKK